MSSQLPQQVSQAMQEAQRRFQHLAQETGMSWERESLFALQAMQESDALLKAAKKAPESLRMAVLNVAQMGLTLNPAYQHAWIIPRDGLVKLDIGYRGLIHLATREGAIRWAKAEVVYESDRFEWHSMMTPPTHKFDPFASDRGNVRGAYVIAVTPEGDYLCDAMSEMEIDRARMMSAAYTSANGPSGPWASGWDDEMRKKVAIKRAQKTWPRKTTQSLLDHAVHTLNTDLGEGVRESVDNGSDAEPEQQVVPADSEIDDRTQRWVDRVIERARTSNAWTAAHQYVRDRFSGANLVWALDRLSKAQNDGKSA